MHKKDVEQEPAGLPYAIDEVTFPVLGKAAVLLLIFTIFSTALAGGAYRLFVVDETVKPAHTLEATPIPPDPNVPILQKDPLAEIRKFRADEYDAERSYSHWTDGDGKTSLRIPISRAMEIVKANGLPKPVKAEPGAQAPTARGGSAVTPPVSSTASTTPASVQTPGASGSANSEGSGTPMPSKPSGPANPPNGSRP